MSKEIVTELPTELVVVNDEVDSSFVSNHKGKLIAGAIGIAVLGAALKYASKHPKWIAYQERLSTPVEATVEPGTVAEVIELGRS